MPIIGVLAILTLRPQERIRRSPCKGRKGNFSAHLSGNPTNHELADMQPQNYPRATVPTLRQKERDGAPIFPTDEDRVNRRRALQIPSAFAQLRNAEQASVTPWSQAILNSAVARWRSFGTP
jgi:hypothetical protein